MILRLTGMSAQFVDQAFADFINEHQLNSVQINFLSLIKAFFTKEGRIDPEKLYDPPFRDYHSSGVDGVFDEDQADKIRSEEHTSELQSRGHLVCRLLLEKKKTKKAER